MRSRILSIILAFAALIVISPSPAWAYQDGYATALVIEETGRRKLTEGYIHELKVRILNGSLKGEIFPAVNRTWAEPGYNVNTPEGSRVIVQIRGGFETPQVHVTARYRAPYALAAVLIFLLVYIYVSGKKSLSGILSIILNIVIVLFVIMPLIRRGYPPVLTTLLASSAGIMLSVWLILGRGKRFIWASGGAIAGVASAAVLTEYFAEYMDLAGLFSDGSRLILSASERLAGWGIADIPSLLTAGIMVAALGSVVDVSVSIASACFSIYEEVGYRKNIWESGISVGRDIIATMLNSLILVFLSTAMPLMIILNALEIPFIVSVNSDMIVMLVTGAFIASSALIISVPATAAVSAIWGSRG